MGRRGRTGFPMPQPAAGPAGPRPWSQLTMDPNHVLQDEDSLCQDLQGLPQLLHPLTLAGRKQPGSGPATEIGLTSVPMSSQPSLLPPPPPCPHPQHNSHCRLDIHVPGLGFELLWADKENCSTERVTRILWPHSLASHPDPSPSCLGFSCSRGCLAASPGRPSFQKRPCQGQST